MLPRKVAAAALTLLTAATLTMPAAHADDDLSDVVFPIDQQEPMDPHNPDYWDAGQHAGGTGDDSQDNGPSYNNQDEPAGGTGDDPGQADFEYQHGSEAAGAF